MNAETDQDLSPEQWETLKAIRVTPARRALNRRIVDSLIELDLAALVDGRPVMTPRGRKVLLRGSPRLWDVAA